MTNQHSLTLAIEQARDSMVGEENISYCFPTFHIHYSEQQNVGFHCDRNSRVCAALCAAFVVYERCTILMYLNNVLATVLTIN